VREETAEDGKTVKKCGREVEITGRRNRHDERKETRKRKIYLLAYLLTNYMEQSP
jgi:hypothetical protein